MNYYVSDICDNNDTKKKYNASRWEWLWFGGRGSQIERLEGKLMKK